MSGIEYRVSDQRQQVLSELTQLQGSPLNDQRAVRLENDHFKLGPKSPKAAFGWHVAKLIGTVIPPLKRVAEQRLDAISRQEAKQQKGAVLKLRSVRALTSQEEKSASYVSLKKALEGIRAHSFDVVPKESRVKAPYLDNESTYKKNWLDERGPLPEEKQLALTQEYEYRLENDPEKVAKKLKKGLKAAKEQQEAEETRGFKHPAQGLVTDLDYSDFKGERDNGTREVLTLFEPKAREDSTFKLHYETLEGGKSAVCHTQSRDKVMEDQHVCAHFTITAQGRDFPVSVTGILDGHGGAGAAIKAKELLAQNIQKRLQEYCQEELTDLAVWNAIKIAFVDTSHSITHTGSDSGSGTTANIAVQINGDLWVANSGDSRAILLDQNGHMTQLSEDAKAKDPKYEESVLKRGGKIIDNRVNDSLAVPRSLGEHVHLGAVSARPKITKVLKEPGQKLIQTCDGVPDVGRTHEIGKLVADGFKAGDTLAMASTRLVEGALRGYSFDNISAMITEIEP